MLKAIQSQRLVRYNTLDGNVKEVKLDVSKMEGRLSRMEVRQENMTIHYEPFDKK